MCGNKTHKVLGNDDCCVFENTVKKVEKAQKFPHMRENTGDFRVLNQ
jgi:hypothetical protein